MKKVLIALVMLVTFTKIGFCKEPEKAVISFDIDSKIAELKEKQANTVKQYQQELSNLQSIQNNYLEINGAIETLEQIKQKSSKESNQKK